MAQGLRHAVHRLAKRHCNLFGIAPVVVFPGADEEQTTGHALVEAVCGGVIAVGETVVVDDNHGEAVIHAFLDDLALLRRDAGRNEDGTLCPRG